MWSLLSRGISRGVVPLLGVLFLSGCATYSQRIGEVESKLAAGKPALALAALEKQKGAERDKALYLLEKAMLLRLNGDFRGSNAAFEEAKGLIDSLSAVSVAETAGSLLINDGTRSYLGEPFEQALLHAYAALNYLDLDDIEAARVESLQADVKLKELAQDDDGPLSQNAFARYLAGIVYEERGEWSDALISYRKAWETFLVQGKLYPVKVPSFLESDLLRLTAQLDAQDEHKRFQETFGRKTWPDAQAYADNGELVFLLHNGLAPRKQERISVIYPPVAERIVTIALPYYEVRPSGVTHAKVTIGKNEATTETVENVNALALKTLDASMPVITTRAIIRAVAKYKLSEKARKENRSAGAAANLAALLTERADTRSWHTLPGEIQMARVLAPPGQYRVKVELLTTAGTSAAVREFDVTLEKGKKQFLSYYWIPPNEGRRAK